VVPAAEPIVAPVTFVLIGESIVFRADASSTVARAAGRRVAFEVDQLSERDRLGWSVTAQGTLESAPDVVIRQLGVGESLVPRADGPNDRWLLVPLRTLAGHWLPAVACSGVDERVGYR
jgi:hypothetical protein